MCLEGLEPLWNVLERNISIKSQIFLLKQLSNNRWNNWVITSGTPSRSGRYLKDGYEPKAATGCLWYWKTVRLGVALTEAEGLQSMPGQNETESDCLGPESSCAKPQKPIN